MRLAAVPVAVLSIVVGIVGMVSPEALMAIRRLYFSTPGLFYTVVAVRFAIGLGLIGSAARSRWPLTLRAIGVVVCLQGLSATLLGLDRAHAIMEWEGMQGLALLRAGAAVALATGAFIVFAVTRGASERRVAMLRVTTCAAVACASCSSQGSTLSQPLTLEPSDHQAIDAVVTGHASTWNSRDIEAMHDLDTEDVEWINVAANLEDCAFPEHHHRSRGGAKRSDHVGGRPEAPSTVSKEVKGGPHGGDRHGARSEPGRG
jgi:hypothetical protein